jgi:hypothetical protein
MRVRCLHWLTSLVCAFLITGCHQWQERSTSSIRINPQWEVDGVPSGLSCLIEDHFPLQKEDAVEVAYLIAHILIGRDQFLKVESAEVGATSDVVSTRWFDDGQEKRSSFPSTGQWAHVTLRARASDRDWSLTVQFANSGVLRVECQPPQTDGDNYVPGFQPSRYVRSWEGSIDTNRALVQGLQVNHILAGIWPGEKVFAASDGSNWTVRVRGVGMPGPETKIKLGSKGEVLSFGWQPRE